MEDTLEEYLRALEEKFFEEDFLGCSADYYYSNSNEIYYWSNLFLEREIEEFLERDYWNF